MEEAVNELKMAKLTVHKLGETFDNFQSHAFSIAALSEQWRALKGSFSVAESSLLNRVKEIESKERALVATEKRMENLEREVELKRKRVDERAFDVELSEKQICDRYEVVKRREKEVIAYFEQKEKELIARFDEKASAIDVRSKALEVKEKELTERFERCSKEIERKETVVDERSKALEVKEKELTKRVERCSREIEGKATVVGERSKDLEVKEKELIGHFNEKATAIDEWSKDLELKEKMIESFEKVRKEFEVKYEEKKLDIDARLKELELKEKKMNEKLEELKVLELREKEVNERVRVLVSIETKLNELIDEYNVKVEQVDEQVRVMASKERELDERIGEYNVKVRLVDEGWKEIEVKEKQIVRRRKVVELKEKDLDDKFRGCELRIEENDQFCRELDSKEKEIAERSKMLELKEKEMNEQCQALELIKKENDERSKVLELREIELKQDSKECKMNGNYVCDKLHTLCRDMDANGLISYLNEHVNDHNELHDEVLDALRFALNPAKLVLDVCKTFHGPYSAKLVITNNQTSCIYLLELLMKLEPEITADVSNEARRFADVWRSRLDKCDDTPWGNFGFLLFLAEFKLSGLYEVEVIAEHLIRLYSEENIYQAEKHVTLCNALGIADNIPDIIQYLIHKHHPLEAIRLAHAFELFHKFPPVPLLQSYLSSTFTKAEKVCRRQDPSKEAQIKFLTTKIGALNFVVRCIKKYDLMSKFPIQPLENLSLELKREKLGLIRVSSLDTQTKSLTASTVPDSNDAYGNFTSLTPFRAMKNEVRSHDFVGSSVTSGSIHGAWPQSMSRNKRPRLFSIQRHEPVNPHLVIPVFNWGAVPSYGNYTCWPFNSRQSSHHP